MLFAPVRLVAGGGLRLDVNLVGGQDELVFNGVLLGRRD